MYILYLHIIKLILKYFTTPKPPTTNPYVRRKEVGGWERNILVKIIVM